MEHNYLKLMPLLRKMILIPIVMKNIYIFVYDTKRDKN